jgi:antitoxin component of RelBE/YafQ-DinJ toxin-antitoxin module
LTPPATGRPLLTFRLDVDQRQQLKARLAADGRTMSEVITSGLRQYVQVRVVHLNPLSSGEAGSRPEAEAGPAPRPEAQADPAQRPEAQADPAQRPEAQADPAPRPALPAGTAVRLRELRASGRSGALSATLAALHADGWPLPALAEALGVSRQAVQARIRQRVPAELRDRAADCAPPPPFPRRRQGSKGRLRPHVTIKIDHALRAAAHLAAAREGHSLSQVVEAILDRYLRHGMGQE